MLKKINYLLLSLIVLIFIACSLIEPKITVNFDEIGDLQESAPVIIDSIQVGKVIEIKQNRSKFEVKIRISYGFRKVITKTAKFYVHRTFQGTRILVKNDSTNNEIITSGSLVDGSDFYERRIKILFDNIGDIIEHRPVNLMNQKNNEERIGEIYDITKKHDKFQVHIRIFHKFKSAIKKRAKFYIVGKGNSSRVVILNINTSLPVLESKMVYGKTQTEFWFDKIKDKIKQMF